MSLNHPLLDLGKTLEKNMILAELQLSRTGHAYPLAHLHSFLMLAEARGI